MTKQLAQSLLRIVQSQEDRESGTVANSRW